MCGCTGHGPTTPSGAGPAVPGSPPSGTSGGAALCCACPADRRISTNGNTDYVPTTFRSSSYSRLNKAHIAVVRTATAGSVTITKSFSLSAANGANTTTHIATAKTAITDAMAAWEAAAASYKVRVEQPGCSPQDLIIKYVATITSSGADVSVSVDNTPAPTPSSNVANGTRMTLYLNGTGNVSWTMIHEVGHTFGLSDEYTYNRPAATPAPSLNYQGASDPNQTVTLSTSRIPPRPATSFAFDNATIMGINGNTTYPKYLFHWISIEVDRLLRSEGVIAVVKIV